VLIGGDFGIGKSTFLFQLAMEMAQNNTVLYVSGEESERQIKMRATRLLQKDDVRDKAQSEMPENLFLVTETNLNAVLEHISDVHPRLLI
jgi:DNA repair protein RadA/Sms